GFYNALSEPTITLGRAAGYAVAGGAVAGAAAGFAAHARRNKAASEHQVVTVNDLEKGDKS
ncbi:MAG: Ni/Fe hydrogenase, partial [Proteobacteria bacterium]